MGDETTTGSGDTGAGAGEQTQGTETTSVLGGGQETDTGGQGGGSEQQSADQGGTGDQGGNGSESDQGSQEQQGAPESYEWTVPEGFEGEMDQASIEAFEPIARELNLSQDQANQLVKLQTEAVQRHAEALQTAHAEQMQQWQDELKNDTEFGGANYDTNVKLAQKAVQTLNMPELVEALNQTGMGNHPAFVKAFAQIGKSVSEDGFVLGNQSTAPKSAADVMYGTENK